MALSRGCKGKITACSMVFLTSRALGAKGEEQRRLTEGGKQHVEKESRMEKTTSGADDFACVAARLKGP